MSQPHVLIVGAGPTGMTLAIELRRFGFNVRIIDKSDHAALHSQALVVQARTLEQLQRYGIASQAVSRGRKLTGADVWSETRHILSFHLNQIPGRYPYVLFLPQTETEAILNACMESLGVKIERNTELLAFSQQSSQENFVEARLRLSDGTEELIKVRWLVGCDGARSTVRQLAGIPFEGESIGLSFVLGDLELEGPDLPTDKLAIRLKRGDVVVMGRLSERFVRVIVALHSEQSSGRNANHQKEITIEQFQQIIDQSGIHVRILSSDWMTPFRVNDRQAKSYRAGNVFLAGDASHIHSPVGGQGMNTGMQDAANLAWKLAAVIRGADDSLLDSYQEERGAVGKTLLEFTGRALKLATTTSSILIAIRNAIIPFVIGFAPARRAAQKFISETAIEYRSSSIVTDCGGDGSLRAGDRMPDLSVGEEDESATLLEDWQGAGHLVLLFSQSEEETQLFAPQLARTRIIRLRPTQLDDEGRKLLGREPKTVIVRPDGYVGFRGRPKDVHSLDAYLVQDGLSAPRPAQSTGIPKG